MAMRLYYAKADVTKCRSGSLEGCTWHESGAQTHEFQARELLILGSVSFTAVERCPGGREQQQLQRWARRITAAPPVPRHNESLATLRARLVYQTRKRGTLESDLLLSTFAKEHLSKMSEHELREFDKLLDEPDWDIYYWAINKKQPPAKWEGTALLDKLRVHAKNEGKVVRSMPALGGWTSSLSASQGSSKE
ncbi:Succinate dehydrogenase assembly factor 1, mitochondrial [Rhizoctonia solani]|uniref:Succinate dehydrogenase assembly factor 2, mitochondrial n=1 Tax=Rhizoctonia solani TaxID=456999 RepID=A0A8H7IK88_9AGAM|nr:Succinate dehydrogenase assembly factor 1, mitochondrial [Rhizoctonia solani]